MRCPKCGHKVAAEKDRCLYCGSAVTAGSPPHGSHASENGEAVEISEPLRRSVVSHRVSKTESVYPGLESLPEHLREKVEIALRQGGEAEFESSDPMEMGIDPGGMPTDKYIDLQFQLARSEPRERVNPLTLTLIFLVSAGVAALVVYIMM